MIHRKRHSGKLWLVVSAADLAVYNILLILFCIIRPALTDGGIAETLPLFLSLNLAYIPVAYFFTPVKILTDRVIHTDRVITIVIKAATLDALCFSALLYFQGILTSIPPSDFLIFYLVSVFSLTICWVILRMSLKSYRRRGYNYERVVIIGTNSTSRLLARNMATDEASGYRILGNFDIAPREGFDGKYLGTIDDIEKYVKTHPVDQIFFALPGEKPEHITKVMKIADDNFIQFFYVPRISRLIDRQYAFTSIGTSPVLQLHPSPLSDFFNRAIKRSFDIFVSSVALALSPVIIIPVAIAIRLSSPGPIFFKQERTGYNGKTFTLYKFRTMRVNSQSDTLQASADDPRKTKTGSFLRRTSIDELPQFYNVLRGDMSIVGPRPHMTAQSRIYTELIDQYMVRHLIRPGITGWAQVNGFRGETRELWQMKGRVEHDVWYIGHWSAMLDINILIRTIINALRGEPNAV